MTAYLAFALVALQALDFITTRRNLVSGGRELNPVVAGMIKRFGPWLGLAIAKGIALAATWLLWASGQDVILAIFVGVYGATVWRNWVGK